MSYTVDISQLDLSIAGTDPADYPDCVDAFVSEGWHADGRLLTEDELDWINDHMAEEVQELARQQILGM